MLISIAEIDSAMYLPDPRPGRSTLDCKKPNDFEVMGI